MSIENLNLLHQYLLGEYGDQMVIPDYESRYIIQMINGMLEFDISGQSKTRQPIVECIKKAKELDLSIASLESYAVTISAADKTRFTLGPPPPHCFD